MLAIFANNRRFQSPLDLIPFKVFSVEPKTLAIKIQKTVLRIISLLNICLSLFKYRCIRTKIDTSAICVFYYNL